MPKSSTSSRSTHNMGILFNLLSNLFFGFSNAFWKKALTSAPFYTLIFLRGIITSTLFGVVWYVLGPPLGNSVFPYLQAIGLAFVSFWGLFFFVKGVEKGVTNITAPIANLNSFGLIVANVYLHEAWKSAYYISFLLAIIGIFFIYQFNSHRYTRAQIKSSIVYGLLASVFWGISYTLFRIPILAIGPLAFSFLLELIVCLCAGVYAWRIGPISVLPKTLVPILILALCIFGGTLFSSLSYELLPVTAISFYSKSQIIFTLVISYFLNNEKLAARQWFGVLCLILSVFVVMFNS